MKIITLTQPWATLVIAGAKRLETRSWSTAYRGELGIHAAKGFPRWAREICAEEPFASILAEASSVNSWTDLPTAQLLGHVNLTGCYPTSSVAANLSAAAYMVGKQRVDVSSPEREFGDFSPGRYAWPLEDPVEFDEYVPMKGQLGLYDREVA